MISTAFESSSVEIISSTTLLGDVFFFLPDIFAISYDISTILTNLQIFIYNFFLFQLMKFLPVPHQYIPK